MPSTPPDDFAKERARDRLAAVGAIAALLAHRGRNRLATIRAALELLQAGREADLSPEHRSLLLLEMDDLLEDFNLGVDMVRCDFGRTEPLSARAAVRDAVADFRARADRGGVALETAFAPGDDLVLADRRLFRQVLLNLLRNAVEALGATPAPRIVLRTAAADGAFSLEVEDNGPGVPAELHDRLGREPAAGSERRAGLGLLLCWDAMVAMDGSIRHLTPKGAPGALFRLTLRLAG